MFFIGGCAGLLVGAIAVLLGGFALPPIYYRLTNPAILRDGQWE